MPDSEGVLNRLAKLTSIAAMLDSDARLGRGGRDGISPAYEAGRVHRLVEALQHQVDAESRAEVHPWASRRSRELRRAAAHPPPYMAGESALLGDARDVERAFDGFHAPVAPEARESFLLWTSAIRLDEEWSRQLGRVHRQERVTGGTAQVEDELRRMGLARRHAGFLAVWRATT